MGSLQKTITEIKNDFRSEKVSLRGFLYNYLYSPRFRVLLNHRIGRYFHEHSFLFLKHLGTYYKKRLVEKRGCDISYKAIIGKRLLLPHPIGIVIGADVEIRDDVTIFQQVTLGSHGKQDIEKKYPIIEDGAKIYAGAKIIGGITIGKNSIIGANAVVNIDVPANSIAVGIPCRIIEKKK